MREDAIERRALVQDRPEPESVGRGGVRVVAVEASGLGEPGQGRRSIPLLHQAIATVDVHLHQPPADILARASASSRGVRVRLAAAIGFLGQPALPQKAKTAITATATNSAATPAAEPATTRLRRYHARLVQPAGRPRCDRLAREPALEVVGHRLGRG